MSRVNKGNFHVPERNLPSRRRFLEKAALVSAGGLITRWPQLVAHTGEHFSGIESHIPLKPNIVFILADDLGYGDLACQNPNSRIPTPNLDRLATLGMRFTDAHSPSAVCTPTRYGTLTGRYCWRTRLKRGVLGPWGPPLIERERLTVGKLLQCYGYHTACIGKWHLGIDWPTTDGQPPFNRENQCNVDFSQHLAEGPTTRGFDSYFGTAVPNYPPYCFVENDRTIGVPTRSAPRDLKLSGRYGHLDLRPGPMLDNWDLSRILPALTDRAVSYIEEQGSRHPGQPFFLYFPLTAPHTPIVPTAEFQGRSGCGLYGDFVMQVDHTVGRVLAALDRTGLSENTLLLFTSDNGPEGSAYARIREEGHFSMGDLRGIKRDLWEGGHRVPFIARWPGRVEPGSVSSETICLTDLMATVSDLIGYELGSHAGEDSYSILPALLGEQLDRPIREATVHHSHTGRFAIRRGDWVLIDSPTGGDRSEPDWFKQTRGYVQHDRPGELFNLSRDISERSNLYDEHPEIVRDLKMLLARYRETGRSNY